MYVCMYVYIYIYICIVIDLRGAPRLLLSPQDPDGAAGAQG